MSRSWLDDTVKILQIVSIPIILIITVYGVLRDYLTDFWKGFVIGALVIFFLMLGLNVYFYWAGKKKTELKPSGIEPIDYVATAQTWAKNRLTGIDVARWMSEKAVDNGAGGYLVTGMAMRTYPPQTYRYHVVMTKDGKVVEESSYVH